MSAPEGSANVQVDANYDSTQSMSAPVAPSGTGFTTLTTGDENDGNGAVVQNLTMDVDAIFEYWNAVVDTLGDPSSVKQATIEPSVAIYGLNDHPSISDIIIQSVVN